MPTKVSATLSLDPAADTFEGSVDLDVAVKEPTRFLWLDATEIDVRQAWVEQNGARIAAHPVPGGEDFLGFAFDAPLATGPARIHATYTGKITDKDDRGVFRMKEGPSKFLFTQFENIEARRAFPCFDEPSFKHPWQITLRVKQADVALSNTPSVEEKVGSDGWKTVRFAETKPLPAYLVAFAVGPFELVDAGAGGKNRTPLRVAVPPGKSGEAAFIRQAAPKLLDLLEAYFEIPFPYEKLDIVSVPNLVSFGAMENVGLITVTSTAVLAQPGEDTPRFRHRVVGYMAHEMAHQWFGDLVTTAWWDDIWLNEGFASWMGAKITHRFDASFGEDMAAIADASDAMTEDGLLSARKVRQEIASKDDIANAFDGITYQKGSAVLDMFESWVGEEAFRKGVHGYLQKFSHRNATSNDFLVALGEGAGKDVNAAFSTFLNQPGVPLVTAALSCDGGAKLALKQERNLPIGSKATTAASWQIPVCVRYGAGKESGRACTLLATATGQLELPKLPGQKGPCPDWVLPKGGGHGYYRVAYAPKDIETLLGKGRASLMPRERLSVVRDTNALVSNGKLLLGDALERVPDLSKDESPFVQSAAVDLASWLRRPGFVDPALSAKVASYVRKVFGPRAKQLGWRPKKDDSAEVRRVRLAVLDLLIRTTDDPKLVADARVLAAKWLEAPDSLEPEVVATVMRAATAFGDRDLFDRIYGLAKTEKDTRRRNKLIAALAGFRDPALVRRSLELLLADDLDPRETTPLLFDQDHRSKRLVWEFVKQNFDRIMDRMPGEIRPEVFGIGEACDEAQRADAEAFLKERAAKVTGAPRTLAQASEWTSLCAAQREAHRASLEKFLGKQ